MGQGIIDFRIKPPFRGFVNLPVFQQDSGWPIRRAARTAPAHVSMEEFFEEMDAAGISRGVVAGRLTAEMGEVGNDVVADLIQLYPDRFIGFGVVGEKDLSRPDDVFTEMDRCGFRGVSFEPPWFRTPCHYDDAVFDELYTACEESGKVLLLAASIFIGPDLSYSNPVHIQRIAIRHPDLPIVVSHVCWPRIQEFLGIAFRYPNVYALPGLYGNTAGLADIGMMAAAANSFLAERTLFGSNYPVRNLRESIDGFASWPIDEKVRRACLYENASRLLCLERQTAESEP